MNRTEHQDRQRHERSLELAATAVDFWLTSVEKGALDAHLASCPTCAQRARALRADASTLAQPFTLLPSARVDAAVHAAIARRTGKRQHLLLLAAAAVLLLAALLGAVAVGAYLLRNRETLRTSVVPTPTSAASVVSPRPDVSPMLVGETWETLDFLAGSSGGFIETLTFVGRDLVGAGRGGCVPEASEPSRCYVSAYTASAGKAWVRASDHPAVEVGLAVGTSSPEAGIFDLAAGPAGIVAIGYGDDGRPRIWRSRDGQSWQGINLDPGSSAVRSRVGAIAASPDGYVIVGWVVDSNGKRARAAAWASPDGATWTSASNTDGMDVGPCFDTGEEPDCGGMLGVVATTSGFVAVGHHRAGTTGPQRIRPAAWTSPDGLTWARSDTGLNFDGRLSDVAAGGPGLTAVGTICQPDCFGSDAGGLAATSVDGTTWDYAAVAGAAPLQNVASTGGRVFTLGVLNRDIDPRAAELQLWQSDDAVGWQRVIGLPSPPDAWFYGGVDIAATSDRLIVVAWAWVTGPDDPQNFSYQSSTTNDLTPSP